VFQRLYGSVNDFHIHSRTLFSRPSASSNYKLTLRQNHGAKNKTTGIPVISGCLLPFSPHKSPMFVSDKRERLTKAKI